MEPALMRAKPRCGHGVAFSKKQEAKLLTIFSKRQAAAIWPVVCLPVLNRIGRGLAIVPATIVHAAALPAFGHVELGGMRRP